MTDAWAHQEFAGSQVPDRRFIPQLSGIASNLARNCEISFSNAVGHGGRQGANRLFRNDDTETDGLLSGHYEQTAARCAQEELVLLVQDTTYLDYTTHKATKGLGPIGTTLQALSGLVAHSVLGVSVEGQPLGILHLDIWARDPQSTPSAGTRRNRLSDDKESRKWADGLKSVQSRLSANQRALVVCDREADVFLFLAAPRRKNIDLLVRAAQPRSVEIPTGDGSHKSDLLTAASQADEVARMNVTVPAKPGRAERVAAVTIRAVTLTMQPPRHARIEEHSKPISLTVVEARESASDELADPIHWVLITTKQCTTASDYSQMVTYYSRRWVIERLHYTLKSGCKVERLQIDDADALRMALSIYFVVAWRLLWLTYIARTDPQRPAAEVLEKAEIEVLEAATGKTINTITVAVLAIASLAGHVHYKTAPPPGPKTLWRGIRKLDGMVLGWTLAHAAKNVNQD